VSDALVIDSALISHGEQVVINVEECNLMCDIDFKSSIHIQHTCGKEYSELRQKLLNLGEKIKCLNGYNSVRDKRTKKSLCKKFQLPFGFDGPMYPLGMHVDSYNPKKTEPVHYANSITLQEELSEFTKICLPMLKR